MASWSVGVLCLLAVCSAGVASNVIDTILKDIEPCRVACSKIFTHNTNPNARHLECCKRGCRFFSLVEFINEGQNVNATKDACMASCLEAYSQTGDRYACNLGCSNQAPFAQSRKEHKTKLKKDVKLLRPFMYVHNIYNNMVNKMSRIISVSWSYYLQQDDGKVVVVQSEPEIITEDMDIDDNEYDQTSDDSDETDETETEVIPDDPTSDVYLYRRQEELEPEEETVSELERPHQKIQLEPKENLYGNDIISNRHVDGVVLPHAGTSHIHHQQESPSGDWLGCFARKSGLPRWLVGFTVCLSALLAVWLCFSSELKNLHRNRRQVIVVHHETPYHPPLQPEGKLARIIEEDQNNELVSPNEDLITKDKI